MLGMAALGWFLSAPFTQAAGKSTTLLPHRIFSWEYLGPPRITSGLTPACSEGHGRSDQELLPHRVGALSGIRSIYVLM